MFEISIIISEIDLCGLLVSVSCLWVSLLWIFNGFPVSKTDGCFISVCLWVDVCLNLCLKLLIWLKWRFIVLMCRMNRLSTLPRGFGSLPALEVLDLTYNNLNETSLPGNFFYLSKSAAHTRHYWYNLIFLIIQN